MPLFDNLDVLSQPGLSPLQAMLMGGTQAVLPYAGPSDRPISPWAAIGAFAGGMGGGIRQQRMDALEQAKIATQIQGAQQANTYNPQIWQSEIDQRELANQLARVTMQNKTGFGALLNGTGAQNAAPTAGGGGGATGGAGTDTVPNPLATAAPGTATAAPSPAIGPPADYGGTVLPISPQDMDLAGRMAFAEAGNQTPEGRAAVLRTITNRLASGRFGKSMSDVLDAENQFEPSGKAGGAANLPPLTPAQAAEVKDHFANMAMGAKDPTNGGLFFLNRKIAQQRGTDFGANMDQSRSTVIGDHTFYSDAGPNAPKVPDYRVALGGPSPAAQGAPGGPAAGAGGAGPAPGQPQAATGADVWAQRLQGATDQQLSTLAAQVQDPTLKGLVAAEVQRRQQGGGQQAPTAAPGGIAPIPAPGAGPSPIVPAAAMGGGATAPQGLPVAAAGGAAIPGGPAPQAAPGGGPAPMRAAGEAPGMVPPKYSLKNLMAAQEYALTHVGMDKELAEVNGMIQQRQSGIYVGTDGKFHADPDVIKAKAEEAYSQARAQQQAKNDVPDLTPGQVLQKARDALPPGPQFDQARKELNAFILQTAGGVTSHRGGSFGVDPITKEQTFFPQYPQGTGPGGAVPGAAEGTQTLETARELGKNAAAPRTSPATGAVTLPQPGQPGAPGVPLAPPVAPQLPKGFDYAPPPGYGNNPGEVTKELGIFQKGTLEDDRKRYGEMMAGARSDTALALNLHQLQETIDHGLQTGFGADTAATLANAAERWGLSGMLPKGFGNATDPAEFVKVASQLAAEMASRGGDTTDAKLANALKGNPGLTLPLEANKRILASLIAQVDNRNKWRDDAGTYAGVYGSLGGGTFDREFAKKNPLTGAYDVLVNEATKAGQKVTAPAAAGPTLEDVQREIARRRGAAQ